MQTDHTTHTPGPWSNSAPVIEGAINPNYRYICAGDGYINGDQGFMLSGFVRPADAALVAAAPELLDALQWLATCAANNSWEEAVSVSSIKDLEHALDRARAAIARATGATP